MLSRTPQLVLLALLAAVGLGGCATNVATPQTPTTAQQEGSAYTTLEADFHDTDIGCDLAVTDSLGLSWAQCFTIDRLEDGSALVCVADGHRYLVVDRGASAPSGLADDICVIEAPLQDVYLVASDTMCVFDALGAIDQISVSGLERDSWHVEAARVAMDEGSIVYGGKYRAPDYELLLERGVTLAIESTMINHTPEVAGKLQELGIPVFVELSSYEPDPRGRLEWVRLWGLLSGREQEAERVVDEQVRAIEAVSGPALDKTVAFFYLNAAGAAVVRRPGDYVSRMIELAGGTYAFGGLEAASAGGTTVTLDAETFYSLVHDADVIVYNGSIDDSITSVADLTERQEALLDAKAVREGQVFATGTSMYQQMVHAGDIIGDLSRAISGQTTGLTYLRHLDDA